MDIVHRPVPALYLHHLYFFYQNLQDHFAVLVGYAAHGLKEYTNQLRVDRLTLAVLNWAIFGKGYLTTLLVGANHPAGWEQQPC